MSGGFYFTIQDVTLLPPEMPTTYTNESQWINLCKVDQEFIASHEKK
jgi:hypothetical protein